MKKFVLFSFFGIILAQNAFAAQTFTCKAKYFNGDKMDALLTGVVVSNAEVTGVALSLNGGKTFSNQTAKADPNYKPRKYVGYKQFTIDVTMETGGEISVFSLLLPKTLGEEASFTGYVTQTAGEGGSYNKVFCELN